MVSQSFPAILSFWPRVKAKDLQPFFKIDMTVFQISPLKKRAAMKNRNLEYGEGRCGLNTKQQSTQVGTLQFLPGCNFTVILRRKVTRIFRSGEWNTVPESQETAKVELVPSWFPLLVRLLEEGVGHVLVFRDGMMYKTVYSHSDVFLRWAFPQTSAGWVNKKQFRQSILVSMRTDHHKHLSC